MSVLFEPQRVGRIELRNRFVRSATHYGLADENGFVGAATHELMRTLASNHIGLIITGYAFVAKSGQVFADMIGIDSDEHIAAYRPITEAVHELGGHIAIQIAHGGLTSAAAVRRGEELLAVSVTDDRPHLGTWPREMTEEDIETIIEAFGQAGRRAQEAGFDGVQIHGAHGYLLTQFLSPRANRRRDRWGGSPENRMRFLIEVTRAVCRQVDDDFPVMIKLGCRDYLDEGVGMTIEQGAEVAAALEREGVCFIEVSHGDVERAFRKISGGKKNAPIEEAYLLPDAEVIRKATRLPLSLVGGMRSLPVAEAIVESGTAECISICRPLIREPDLIARWRAGDTRPAECISCRACFKGNEDSTTDIHCRQIKDAERI